MIWFRMWLTRLLFRWVEVAFEQLPKSTNIPGHYTQEESAALNAIWKIGVVRDIKSGKFDRDFDKANSLR